LNNPAIRKLENDMNGTSLPLEPTIVAPEQALMIRPFGLNMKVLLTSEATGGAVSVVIAWHKPGEGPPDHVHFSQEEIFYIIDGIYELTVGERTEAVGPGAIVFIPRNIVHRFKNIGDRTACMLDWSLPAGQDHYFQEISKLAVGGGFTGEKVVEISKKFDTNFPPNH
jgi:quercetin dioxygenase-like cupin family protein